MPGFYGYIGLFRGKKNDIDKIEAEKKPTRTCCGLAADARSK
jgi:hypothetical protein